jgi:hypothetical protein
MGVVVQLPARHYPPRPGSRERIILRKRLAIEYRSGASIRAIAQTHVLSYYFTRRILIEADIVFRTRARRRRLQLVRVATERAPTVNGEHRDGVR